MEETPLALLVVWEPVILTDVAPPTTGVLAKISDPRAIQYWDGSRALSGFLLRTARDEWRAFLEGEKVAEDSIVWDYVFVFPADSTWDDSLAPPDLAGGPVVAVIDDVRGRLSRLARQ
jgi:hypothetical protein